jgi:hypothetical protein
VDIEPLAHWSENPSHNTVWHTLIEIDPQEFLDLRDKVKLQLSRYGKLGVPSDLLGWDDVEAVRVRKLHKLLGELLDEEGSAAALEQ